VRKWNGAALAHGVPLGGALSLARALGEGAGVGVGVPLRL